MSASEPMPDEAHRDHSALQTLLSQLDAVVFEADAQGITRYVSDAWTQLTQLDTNAVVGADLAEFLEPEDRAGHRARITALVAGQRDHCQHEVRVRRGDGELRWLEVHAHVFTGRDGTRSIAGTLTDMTMRRTMEDTLRDVAYVAEEARADAESALQLLRTEIEDITHDRDAAAASHRSASEFIASMAHDLRTPLNGVLGMTEILLHSKLDESQKEHAMTVRTSAESVVRLIDDLVQFARACAGDVHVEEADFSLRPLLEDLTNLLAQKSMLRGVSFHASVAPNVPDRLHGGIAPLRQMLTNLASNAVRFTDDGEVSIFVERRNVPDANGRVPLRIEVRDRDLRQSAARLAAGQPLEHAVEGGSGTAGMGFAISRRLVELLGGSLAVTAQPGSGCVIAIEIDLQRAVAEAPAAPRASSFSMKVEPLGLRVLVAEDNAVNQKVVTRMLERFGIRADIVGDGQAAIEAADANAYDVILMDVLMPKISGLQATVAIRDREHVTGRHTPIIAMTAHALSGDRDRCLEAGMDGFVSKPLQPDVLYDELAQWVPRDRQDRAAA